MQRTTSIVCAAFLLLFCALGCTATSSGQPNDGEAPDMNPIVERYKEAQEQFMGLKAAGHDMQELEAMAIDFNKAVGERRPADALLLLGRIEAKLEAARRETAEGEAEEVKQAPVEHARAGGDIKDVSPQFGFGIEYAAHGLAKDYSLAGANWTKITNVAWEAIEPARPVGGKHKYNWTRLDDYVTEYQAHNYNILTELKSKSSWGLPVLKDGTAWGGAYLSALPREQHIDDYADFVRNVVERYDADGIKDMPGLRMPILHYEIESEAANYGFWTGPAKDYIRMLRVAYAAAKEANPDVQVVLSGINLGDWVHDMPTEGQLAQRIEEKDFRTRMTVMKVLNFVKETLKEEDYFDIVEFHSNEDYRSMAGVVDWIRREMRKNGYEKPIWIGDALSVPSLKISVPGKVGYNPYLAKNGDEVYQAVKTTGRRTAGQRKLVDWYQAKQSDDLVKKFVLAMYLGTEGVMMGLSHDWPGFLLHNFQFAGLMDTSVVRTKPYPVLGVKAKRPAWYGFKQVTEKLKGAETIQKIDAGPDVYVFKLIVKNKPVFVCWAERENAKVKIDVDAPAVVKESVIRDRGQTRARPEFVEAEDGTVDLALSPVPVFLEPRE